MMKLQKCHYYYLLVIFSLIICRNNVAAANNKDKKPPVPAPTPSFVKRVRVDLSPFYLLLDMDNPTSDNVNTEILEGGTNEFFDNIMLNKKDTSFVKSVFSATVISDIDDDTTNRFLRRSLISNSDGKTKTIIQMDGFAKFDANNAPTKDKMEVLEKDIFDDEYVNYIEQMKGITNSNVPLQVQMSFDKSGFDLNKDTGGTGTGGAGTSDGNFEQIGGGSNGSNAGGIAGGVIGAFVVFCVASLLFVKMTRRGDDNEEANEEDKRSKLKTSTVKKRNNIYINNPIENDAGHGEKKSTSEKCSQKTDIMANDDGSVFEMIFPNSQISLSHGLRKVFASSPQRINIAPNDYDDAYSLDGSDGIDESKPNLGDQMLGQVLALNEIDYENMLVSPNNTINTHSPVDMSSNSYSYEGINVEIFSGEKKQLNNKFRRETVRDLRAANELEYTSSQDNDNIVWRAFDETNSTTYNEDVQVKSSVSTPCLMDDCQSSPESQSSFMANTNTHKEPRIDHGSYRVIETERVHNTVMPKSPLQKRKAKITVITEAPSPPPPPKTPVPGRFPIQAANSYRSPHNYVEDSESELSEKYESGSGMDDNSMSDESDMDFASQQVKNDKRMTGKQREGILRPALVDCNHFPTSHPNPAYLNDYDNRSIVKNLAYDPAEARNSRKNRLTRSLIVDPSRKCNVENHSKAELASNLRKTRLQQQRQQVSSPKVSRTMRNSRYR